MPMPPEVIEPVPRTSTVPLAIPRMPTPEVAMIVALPTVRRLPLVTDALIALVAPLIVPPLEMIVTLPVPV